MSMLVSKASRSDLLRRLSQSRNPEVMRRVESSHGQEAEYRHMLRPFQGQDDFDRRSDRKSINFVERFGFDSKDGSRRLARPGLKTSLPRRRSLTEEDKTYLGLAGNNGRGTRQGLGAFRGGDAVGYELTGNRRVRKALNGEQARRLFQVRQRMARGVEGERDQKRVHGLLDMEARGKASRAMRRRGYSDSDLQDELFLRSPAGRKESSSYAREIRQKRAERHASGELRKRDSGMASKQQSFGGNGAVGRRIPESELVEKGALMAANAASSATRAGKRTVMSPLTRKTPTTAIPSLTSLGKRPPVAVAKRGRSYDPESRRQRRLGAEVATGVLTGGVLASRGVRGAVKSTRIMRRGAKFGPHNSKGGVHGRVVEQKDKDRDLFIPARPHELRRAEHLERGFGASRRDLAQIFGGSGIAGGSIAAGHHASRDSNDRWY